MELTETDNLYLKNLFQYSDAFKKYLFNRNNQNYYNKNVFHARLGNFEITMKKNDIISLYSKYKEYIDNSDILLTDSIEFKNYVSSQNRQITIFDNKPIHTGFDNQNIDNIYHTFSEYDIIINSNRIYTYSCFNWTSGFVLYPSILYDIQLHNIKYIYRYSVFGCCRQDSLNGELFYDNFLKDITYCHNTKEILQLIKYINKNNINLIDTTYCFRKGILENKSLLYDINNKKKLESMDVFILEIATTKVFYYKDLIIHDASRDIQFNSDIRETINSYYQTKEEVYEDVKNIKTQLNKKIIIVGHLCTRNSGKRYILNNWLKDICSALDIIFINPICELLKLGIDIDTLFLKKENLIHYNKGGHTIIKNIYKKTVLSLI